MNQNSMQNTAALMTGKKLKKYGANNPTTLFDLDFGVWILDFSFCFAFWDVMGNPMNGTEKKREK